MFNKYKWLLLKKLKISPFLYNCLNLCYQSACNGWVNSEPVFGGFLGDWSFISSFALICVMTSEYSCLAWLSLIHRYSFIHSLSIEYLLYARHWTIFPGGSDSKESVCNAGNLGSVPGSGRFPWRMKLLPTPQFLLGKFHEQRSLVGYSSWGHKESNALDKLDRSSLLEWSCSPPPPPNHPIGVNSLFRGTVLNQYIIYIAEHTLIFHSGWCKSFTLDCHPFSYFS